MRFGRAAVVATRAIGDARAGREDAAARDDDDDDAGAVEFELDFYAREIRARESERGVETMVFESDAEDEYERIAARMEARMEEAFEAEERRRRSSVLIERDDDDDGVFGGVRGGRGCGCVESARE